MTVRTYTSRPDPSGYCRGMTQPTPMPVLALRRLPVPALAAIAAAWSAAGVLSLTFAAETHVGRVVVSLSRNHGVHAGDVLAAGAFATLAALFSVVVVSRCRRVVSGRA